MQRKITDGLIDVGSTESDLLLDGEVQLPPLLKQDDKRYEYNQGVSKDCTVYSAMKMVSDLFNYEFSPEAIAELNELSYKAGRQKGHGWKGFPAIKLVSKWWNEKFPDKRILYYRVDPTTKNFLDAIKKNYTVTVYYRGNSEYQKDYLKDGVVDGVKFFPTTYGHATCCIWKEKECIQDSYKGRSYRGVDRNTYALRDLLGLVASKNYYDEAYLYVPEEKHTLQLEEIKRLNNLKTEHNKAIQANSTAWHLYDSVKDGLKQDELHSQNNMLRMWVEEIDRKLVAFK